MVALADGVALVGAPSALAPPPADVYEGTARVVDLLMKVTSVMFNDDTGKTTNGNY